MKSTTRVFFLMVSHPSGREIRVGPPYATRRGAQGWKTFVSKAWRGLPVSISPCVLHWTDGVLSPESIRLLDGRYNMDPPGSPIPPAEAP